MTVDDVREFVSNHPKEIAIGVGGLVAGYFFFGRKANATEGESDVMDTPDFGSDGITPFPTTPTNPGNTSPIPPALPGPSKAPSPGPVPKEIAKLFICPTGFYRVWGRDNNANTVMCRSNASKKDIPAMRRKSTLEK